MGTRYHFDEFPLVKILWKFLLTHKSRTPSFIPTMKLLVPLALIITFSCSSILYVGLLLPQSNLGRKTQLIATSAEKLSGHAYEPYYEYISKLKGVSLSSIEKAAIEKNSFKILGRRTVVVTVGTEQVQDYVQNLNCYVRISSNVRPIIFSLDSQLSELLRAQNLSILEAHYFIPLFSDREMKNGSTALFGTEHFSIITHSKIWIAYLLIQEGYDFIMTDLDVIWCKDMTEVFAKLSTTFPTVDIFMQSNQRNRLLKAQLNTGFYYARSSEQVFKLYKLLVSAIPNAIRKGQDDQGLFWDLICCPPLNHPLCPHVTWRKYNNIDLKLECHWKSETKPQAVVKIQYLPLRDFPNGYSDGFNRGLNEIPPGFYHKQCITKNITIWHVNFCTGKKKRVIMQNQEVFSGAHWKGCKFRKHHGDKLPVT